VAAIPDAMRNSRPPTTSIRTLGSGFRRLGVAHHPPNALEAKRGGAKCPSVVSHAVDDPDPDGTLIQRVRGLLHWCIDDYAEIW